MDDNRLEYLDQATYLSLRATGRAQLAQSVWVYERPLDYAGLKTFHQNFGYGLAGRRIEHSALPFGRHRWVSSVGPATEIHIAEEPRPRTAMSDWIDERAELPVDPQRGPGWHLGVLPMTDGSTAVSLVGSHCLFDGLGFLQTIAEAVNGTVRDFGYPPPRSRTRRRAIIDDAIQTGRDLPALVGALGAGVRLARTARQPSSAAVPPGATGADDHRGIVVPTITVFVDIAAWDHAAEERGGNSHSLLAGLSTRLGTRLDRCRAGDGTVALLIAISDRGPDDTRANALRFARVNVEAATASTDLATPRAAIRSALAELRETPDETFALLPLTPFIPKRAVKRMGAMVFGDLPVSCSNLGDVDAAVGRVDGTDADYVMWRPVDQNVKRAQIEDAGGQLVLAAGRITGKISISVVAYQPGAPNTKAWLRTLAGEVLDEFGLTAEIV
ncbi:hypothetical protein ACRCUN_09785 [Mycobacterium sp. LTG2003]